MNFLVPVYQQKSGGMLYWQTLGGLDESSQGRNAVKMQEELTRRLKRQIADMTATAAARLCEVGPLRLLRVSLDLSLKGTHRTRVGGKFPLVLERRWANDDQRMLICYHPLRAREWFTVPDDDAVAERATIYFKEAWRDLAEHEIARLQCAGRDLLRVVAFDAHPTPLPREDKGGIWAALDPDRKKKAGDKAPLVVLPQIGVDLTPRAVDGQLPVGRAREPYRSQLNRLLGGEDRRSVVLVGDPGSGKTTLVNRFVADLLERDDYPSHLSFDRVHHVWRIAGRRLIAGMSHVGDWEKRCGDLIEEMQDHKILLFVEDIAAFGRIGQSRDSERSLADYFRAPVARGDVVMIAEGTPEALARLEEDNPSFAGLFLRLDVAPTRPDETYALLFHEARRLELEHRVSFEVTSHRTVFELTDALYPSAAFPGKALDVLRALARQKSPGAMISEGSVVDHLCLRTGLSKDLLRPESAADARAVAGRFAARVLGQEAAVQAATDLVLRVREGLTDPARPYAVMLFTGPTGTGKTELAKAIAEHQYGSLSRLVRIDMSELAGPDGPSRLMGDRFRPEGLLTRPIQEQPFSVVLLDEVEKAHPSVLNLLLQLFDEGRLTDAAGRVADFRRAVVIMTSNLGARRRAPVGFDEAAEARAQQIARAVRDFFPPELFNRIDRVVPFHALDASSAQQVADKELGRLVARRGLVGRRVYVAATQAVLQKVVAEGFDADHGARTVKRYLEEHVASRLSDVLTDGATAEMRSLTLYVADGALRVHEEALTEAAPVAVTLGLEGLEGADTATLTERCKSAQESLHRVVEAGGLLPVRAAIAERLERFTRGEAPDDLEILEAFATSVAEAAAVPEPEEQADELWSDYEDWDGQGALPAQLPKPDEVPGLVAPLPQTPEGLLEEIARLGFLERQLGRSLAPARHMARLTIRHVGPVLETTLVTEMATAYGGLSNRWAACSADGVVSEGVGSPSADAGARPVFLVMDLVQLGLQDRLRFEPGTHALEALAEGVRLAVVEVNPVGARTLRQVAQDHLDARAEFEDALETGRVPLPENPDRLLPLVRRLRLEPSDTHGVADLYHIEDYRLQVAKTVRADGLGPALAPLWRAISTAEEER